MRVLVTGGAGFIGSHLVDAYLARGETVAVLDNFVTGLRSNLRQEAALYEVDLADRDAVAAAIDEFRPEFISHQAAHLSVYQSVDDPWYNAQVNLIGLLNLMEPAVKQGLRRIVAASSGGVLYGDDVVHPTPETAKAQPVSPYGVSKLATEAYLQYYAVQHGIESVLLRYANVYGPRQNPEGETGVVSIFLERMTEGRQPIINGDGDQTRDYVYVDDVVSANLAATTAGRGVYNIGTGVETNVVTVFQTLQQALKTEFPQLHGPARQGEQRRSVLDCQRANLELDWEPAVLFDDGIERTVAWYSTTTQEGVYARTGH